MVFNVLFIIGLESIFKVYAGHIFDLEFIICQRYSLCLFMAKANIHIKFHPCKNIPQFSKYMIKLFTFPFWHILYSVRFLRKLTNIGDLQNIMFHNNMIIRYIA